MYFVQTKGNQDINLFYLRPSGINDFRYSQSYKEYTTSYLHKTIESQYVTINLKKKRVISGVARALRVVTRPTGGPKWGKKRVKFEEKIRKIDRNLRKKIGKWNSCPLGEAGYGPVSYLLIISQIDTIMNETNFESFRKGCKHLLKSFNILCKIISNSHNDLKVTNWK